MFILLDISPGMIDWRAIFFELNSRMEAEKVFTK
jgi:hypothetical protein